MVVARVGVFMRVCPSQLVPRDGLCPAGMRTKVVCKEERREKSTEGKRAEKGREERRGERTAGIVS